MRARSGQAQDCAAPFARYAGPLCNRGMSVMEWRGRRGSSNIEDRRASGVRSGRAGGIGGVGLIAVLVIGYFLGIDVTPLLNGAGQMQTAAPAEMTEADTSAGEFVSVVLADTEDIWAQVFKTQLGDRYSPATLVLYKGVTASPCGDASGATGPFYCPRGSQGLP